MKYTKSPLGLKQAIPFTFKDGFVSHYNGTIPIENAISSTMEELNFTQEDPSYSINDIDKTWMQNLFLDPRWEKKIGNYSRWQLDQFHLKENKRAKVEILSVQDHDSSYSFAWRVFDASFPLKDSTYIDCLDVCCFSELFNPFINGFRSWWKENQNVLCE